MWKQAHAGMSSKGGYLFPGIRIVGVGRVDPVGEDIGLQDAPL